MCATSRSDTTRPSLYERPIRFQIMSECSAPSATAARRFLMMSM